MKVKDVMIPVVGHVQPEDSLRDAAAKMKALNLSPIPVVEDGKVVGLLTEQLLIERAEKAGLAVGAHRVRDTMSTDIVCCSVDQDVAEAREVVGKEHTARLPVIDEDHRLVGIVSAEDLRKRVQTERDGVSAVEGVESVGERVPFEDDQVDFMSDASFPASDPMPPPTTLGRPCPDDP